MCMQVCEQRMRRHLERPHVITADSVFGKYLENAMRTEESCVLEKKDEASTVKQRT